MNLIVAVDNNWGIGKDNHLLYDIKGDMAYFRKTTLNKVVVMGEKTFLSFPNQQPLKNRTNIVLSDDPNFNPEGVIVVRSLNELFDKINEYNEDEVYLIGGASLYNLLMPYCKRALITKIDAVKEADKYLNNIDDMPNWFVEDESEDIVEGEFTYKFITYINLSVERY